MSRHGWIQDPRTQETKRFHDDEKPENATPGCSWIQGDLFQTSSLC